MASNNRVFVSPGVYTSEVDLTFVAQSVGVTTLGLVGETLQGPAFEPILISSFDNYKSYFGPTSPEKDGNNNPKYELGYVAKSYLQESNQLFVTRVLGLTGYNPYKTFGIVSQGGILVDHLEEFLSGTYTGNTASNFSFNPNNPTASDIYNDLSNVMAFNGMPILDYISQTYSGLTSSDSGKWFAIGFIPSLDPIFVSLNAKKEQVSPLTGKIYKENENRQEWYNTCFRETVPGDETTIYDVASYLFRWTGGTSFDGERFEFRASMDSDYDNVVVAALRSRGHYHQESLMLEVTQSSKISLTDTGGIVSNPLAEFQIDVTGVTGGHKSFTVSLDQTSSKYITKALGVENYDQSYIDHPVYVHEVYPNWLKNAFEQGKIRGLQLTYEIDDASSDFIKEYDTPMSNTVVSEVRGGKVDDLFNVITISDGESANKQVKITIQNINLDSGEFDLLVRDFNDTDDNVVVLEKYSRCSMNPDVAGYIARKIGTSDGEYTLNSKYIMLSMAENAPIDAVPAGFKGFTSKHSFGDNSKLGAVTYKTNYFDAGETMYYKADGTPVLSSGDKFKKVSLGLSSQNAFTYDSDLLKFKGLTAAGTTKGFHLSTNASTITGTTYITTGYDLEGQSDPANNKLTNINYRKFTFGVFGGFDGWDIYRNVRTNTDQYIFNTHTYISGNTNNGGIFSLNKGNSDYYAYLKGIQTYANPEAVDINVFATPGIDFLNHSSLVTQAIDMIENERADSIYIIGAPNETDATTIVDDLDTVSIDSNYSATYWPWIQVRDTDNATQLYIPPTGEVVKNIALTDNVSYPWFAVAGYSRGLVNAIKAQKKLTLDERDTLYKNRINPIATFSDTGTIIWGNKTLQVRESALDRINVRRLLLRARKLISAVAVRLLFEQNDDQVRQEFLRLVNPILEAIKKERGLYDFRVTVSSAPEDIDANTLRGKIYVKPTRSLEFIDLEFVITPTGASFENI
jgi:Phage tail sheath protein subtilisin-like domain